MHTAAHRTPHTWFQIIVAQLTLRTLWLYVVSQHEMFLNFGINHLETHCDNFPINNWLVWLFLFFLGVKNPIQSLETQDTVPDRCPPTYGDGPERPGKDSLNVCHGGLSCMLDLKSLWVSLSKHISVFQWYDRDSLILQNTFSHHLSSSSCRWHWKSNLITRNPKNCRGLVTDSDII